MSDSFSDRKKKHDKIVKNKEHDSQYCVICNPAEPQFVIDIREQVEKEFREMAYEDTV